MHTYLSENDSGYKILIPSSKTDVYRNGKTVFLSKSNGKYSVSNLLSMYMSKANLSLGLNHFLFGQIRFDKGIKNNVLVNNILSYSSFREIIKQAISSLGLDSSLYGTHSCRSGGATDLAPKVNQFELLLCGRWRDPRSIGSYVEVDEDRRFDLSRKLELKSF